MSPTYPRYPTLNLPAMLFAHRGARAHAPENTLEAFTLAQRLGVNTIESDVWLTADGQAVLDHDGVVGPRLRRRPLSQVERVDLPEHIPTLAELYEACGSDVVLSLDLKDPEAFGEVLAVAEAVGATSGLWLCHPDLEVLTQWRERSSVPRLVNSTFLGHLDQGPERRIAELRERSIDALNLHHSEWNAGLVAMCHRFGRYAFGWDAQHERVIRSLWDMGIDAIYSDHVDRLLEVCGPSPGA